MSNAVQQPPIPHQVEPKLVYVVDDESMVGEVVQMVLRMDGYKPTLFLNPQLALQSFLSAELKPVLLLTDFLMTPINGMELIMQCKQHQPCLKTIVYSGNAKEDVLGRYTIAPDGFLRKPFLPKTLLNLVQFVLNGARGVAMAGLSSFVWCTLCL